MASFFKLLCQSCGLPLKDAMEFLGTRVDTTKSWYMGRRKPPESVLEKLIELSVKQDIAAQEILLEMGLLEDRNCTRVTLKEVDSDSEAKLMGWPSANAYRAVIRRVVEKMPPALALKLVLVSQKSGEN